MTAAGVAYHYRPTRRGDLWWQDQAKCFDPNGYNGFTERTVAEQLAVCQSGCPVQAECALYGVEGPPVGNGKDAGGMVYGAMRPRTLKRLQKARGVVS